MKGILYLVGTPIGNLGDITLRALETLRQVDYIACEDTRHSLKLLNYYEIKKPLIATHQHNERESVSKIVELLEQDKSIALITDAGMPCISDPGSIIVSELFEQGYNVQVVPGATAVATALALSGITYGIWTFIGFLPFKEKEKNEIIEPFVDISTSLVLYSSPYDINKDLAYLYKKLGDRKVHIIKELTKIHESHIILNLDTAHIDSPKGEYVIIVEKSNNAQRNLQPSGTIQEQLIELINDGVDKKTAIKQIAKNNNLPKDDVYKVAIKL